MANTNLKNKIKDSCFLALGFSSFQDPKAISLFDKLYTQTCEEILSIGRWGVATYTQELKKDSKNLAVKPLRVLYCSQNNYIIVSDGNGVYKLKKTLTKDFTDDEYPINIEMIYNIFEQDNLTPPPYLEEVLIDKMAFKLCNALGFGNQEKALIYAKYENSLKEARYIDSCTYYNNELKVNNVV